MVLLAAESRIVDQPGSAASGVAGWLNRLRPYAVEIAITPAVTALLWVAIALLLSQQKEALLSGARHDTANLARAFEENTAHAIDAADQSMLLIRSAYNSDPAHFTFVAWNKGVVSSDGMILQTSLADKNGIVTHSNLGPVTDRVDISDREHFRVQRDNPSQELFISKPVRGRESHRWSVQLTRRVLATDGTFDGIIVASLDPYVLSRAYTAVDIGRGTVFLAGLDGIIRGGAPDVDALLERDVRSSPVLAAARDAVQGTLAFTDQTGAQMIASYRRLTRYGLVIAVALNRSDVLAVYYDHRRDYIVGGIGLTIVLLLIGGRLLRHRQHLLRMGDDLVQSRGLLSETLQNMTQGIMLVDADRRLPVLNRRAIELLGLPGAPMARDLSFDDLLVWQAAHGEFGDPDGSAAEAARLAEQERFQAATAVYERTRPNGVILEVRTRRLSNRRTIRTLTDVTERRTAEDRVTYLAHYDALTGLANRARFRDRLAEAVGLAQRTGSRFTVLFLDLDNFKLVNDTWGHAAGDRLLEVVAERLRACVRETDTVARFGGDEFAILQGIAERPDAGAALAQRLMRDLSEPYEIAGRQITVGVSVGVAFYPHDGHDPDGLIKNADIALYAAKDEGRGRCRFFEPEMDHRLQERAELVRDLREAVAADQMDVHYQPICDAASGRPIGYEALARWRHPVRGDVSPTEFIPLAEEANLIADLGYSVMRTACRTAAGWPGDTYVTVNFSPMQLFDPGFEHIVLGVLRDTGLPPTRLGIEITEGVLIREGDAVPTALRLLQRHGVRILLDDFGTGHAGLSYLLRFPFNCIKLDRSFVSKVVDDEAARAVIRATLVLSESLRLDVVAEGVETAAQRDALRAMGCTRIQGYLFGKPMPAERIPGAVPALNEG